MSKEEEPKLIYNENVFDVYIRMKASYDHDYCFQITTETTFRDLFKIFNILPINFSPSIFYDKIPVGFQISNYPGVLTRSGGILFGIEADYKQYLTNVKNLDDKISDHCLPGQLILPIFPERTFLHYSVVSAILVWLYTDLPDSISPTPGICLTNKITDVIVYVLSDILGKPDRAQAFYNDIHSPVGPVGETIYFVFHIFKVLLLYFILWAGLFNPYSFRKPSLSNLNRENLLEIGWTGAKKLQRQSYQDSYRKLLVAKYGNIMNIYRAGKLSYIKEAFVVLKNGEGYDYKNLDSNPDAEFKLTRDLLLSDNKFLYDTLAKLPYNQAHEVLKLYRQVGTLDPSPELAKLTAVKFSEIDKVIESKEAENKVKFEAAANKALNSTSVVAE